jgi:hypothetical protein
MRPRALQRVLWLLLCWPLSCNQLSGNRERTLVELDAFSGRPNPRWELDEPSSQQLRQLQGRLTSTLESVPEPPGLGYRGFLYADGSGQVRAYRGFVKTPGRTLADPTFSIEKFLLDRLPAELADLRARIVAELTPK